MHLKDFSWVYPNIQNVDVLKAIETAIPAFAIEQAIANTKTEEERRRSLPAQLVVSLVIAMSLWSRDSMRDVLKNLIDGLSEQDSFGVTPSRLQFYITNVVIKYYLLTLVQSFFSFGSKKLSKVFGVLCVKIQYYFVTESIILL